MFILLLIGIVFLLLLNAFFVLAEFAIVKVRPSRLQQLIDKGDKRAEKVKSIQAHLDEYLSVCQLGITLASIALGMVGEQASEIITGESGSGSLRYFVAIIISYLFISGSHVLIGELVPKSIAIRLAEKSSLTSANFLILFHKLFFPALWLLTNLASLILKGIGVASIKGDSEHSREELQILLKQYQRRGLLSFRRLLYIENVFDLETMTVSDVMRKRHFVSIVDAKLPWEKNLRVIKLHKFTRYPLILSDNEIPKSFIHVKDILIEDHSQTIDLSSIARPLLIVKENSSLEFVLSEMQKNRKHIALVVNKESSDWIGLVSFEDIIEELIGSIRDEFENEESVKLSDIINVKRVLFNTQSDSLISTVENALKLTNQDELPILSSDLLTEIKREEKLRGIYFDSDFALIQLRLKYTGNPFMMILHLGKGAVFNEQSEKVKIVFLLLTPSGVPRIHKKLQSILIDLLHDSKFVKESLLTANSPEEVVNIIKTGEQAALD